MTQNRFSDTALNAMVDRAVAHTQETPLPVRPVLRRAAGFGFKAGLAAACMAIAFFTTIGGPPAPSPSLLDDDTSADYVTYQMLDEMDDDGDV